MHSRDLTASILGFCLVISIFIGLIILIFVVFKPNQTMAKLRDQQRLADINKLQTSLELYLASGHNFDHLTTGQVYISTPGQNDLSGAGWLPLDFSAAPGGVPMRVLSIDPLNNQSHYYSVGVNVANKTFEIDCQLEDSANAPKMTHDQGNNPDVYEVGNDLTILK